MHGVTEKDPNFTDIHHILGDGYLQNGVDICAKYKHEYFGLIGIECKCWQELSVDNLKKTLNKFLEKII